MLNGVPRKGPVLLQLCLSAAAFLLLSGCGESAVGGEGGLVVTDSAGIEIVSNPAAGMWGQGEGWRAREVFRLGEVDGTEGEVFERPGEMVPDGEGGVFLVEGGENALRRYGPDGSFLGRLGGTGEGPGEFGTLRSVATLGDTVLALDSRNRRVTRFLTSGELLGTRPLGVDYTQQGVPVSIVALGDGRLLLSSPQGCAMPAPEDRRAAGRINVALRPDPDGTALEVAGPVARWHDRSMLPLYGERFCSVVPGLAGHAAPLAVRADGVAAVAPGPGYEIHVFRVPEGADTWTGGALGAFPTPERIVRREYERRPVTAEDRSGYRDARRPEDLTDPMSQDIWGAIQAAWDTTAVPDLYPAIQELRWDDRGHLWVQRRGGWDEPHGPWDVFDGDGRYLGEVDLPPELTVRLIHGDRVWGTETGELDVQQLVSLEVLR